jgi:hypothetical protein
MAPSRSTTSPRSKPERAPLLDARRRVGPFELAGWPAAPVREVAGGSGRCRKEASSISGLEVGVEGGGRLPHTCFGGCYGTEIIPPQLIQTYGKGRGAREQLASPNPRARQQQGLKNISQGKGEPRYVSAARALSPPAYSTPPPPQMYAGRWPGSTIQATTARPFNLVKERVQPPRTNETDHHGQTADAASSRNNQHDPPPSASRAV